jgi:benzoyl-CoA reductase/2-hydroxyglutaryl-CoA dehydratase subunit BcrC/BadD/HgdB
MKMMDIFDEALQTLQNRWMKDWIKQGNKIMGYYCSYIPEELMDALNIMPIRLRPVGVRDTGLADAYMSLLNCTYARCMLNIALEDKLNFLEGIVGYNSCDHVRRMYDNLKWKVKLPFYHFLSVPHHGDEAAIAWFHKEILNFKSHLEDHFKRKIEDTTLTRAIKDYNKFRTLIQQLYDMRKVEEPVITGEEAMKVNLASVSMRKRQITEYLKKFLEECKDRQGISGRIRLMIAGGQLDNPEYIKIIENLGGLVVTDFNCFGTRYFTGFVKENGDPYMELARRYLLKIPCPRMIDEITGHKTRFEHLKRLIKEYSVDGVIFQKIIMCDFHAGENYLFTQELDELGVPTIDLEREYMLSGVGQFKTRVQAFMEILT